MPQVVFEPTIQVFERTKKVHALDRAATGVGNGEIYKLERPKFILQHKRRGNSTSLIRVGCMGSTR
jgi:hypothetical protein